ncbi:protein-glutamine gamma-glutamyltransferase [mine drainage metagenome]|uniref:Protein-glutamine gamma-glutamyltransferase n=1 Tax=mine drainage metagenome TaxID=410659 RepID=A0A1J5TI12_9ZZZZ
MKLGTPLIYGLLASILLVSAPHADHLPPWVSAVCMMLLAWRAYLTYSGSPLPARWLLLAVTVACVAGIAITFHTLFGREAGVTLLILLATLKLLELRAVRDATVLIYLSCFIIITNFFYSQSIPTALFMLLSLLVIVTTWLHLQTGTLNLVPRVRIAGLLLLQAIPLMLLLFVLFPRVQGPLWGMPQDAYASSGLTDRMTPGSMSKLSMSDAVAFRVVFAGKPPLREQMYWRGPVLWDYDGTTWTRGRNATLQRPQLDDAAAPIDYTVTLEPHNKPWLFALEMPAQISIPADLAPDFQLLNRAPVNARLRYNVRSFLSYRANPGEPQQQLQRALALPPGYNPQATRLAAEWRAAGGGDMAVVRAALAYFNRNGFEYTLEPPLLGTNGVDEFLFTTKKGFCEHYAGSFVFLMRAAGIPARVVTGYQGGEYNDLGGYYILRQWDAHAWAEVWLPDSGWMRIDPTAAIAPARIQNGLTAALPDNAALPFLARTQSPFLLKLRFNLDALTNQWNQWVLGYNTERQFAFLTRLGMEDVTWQRLAMNLLAGVALIVGALALFMLRHLYKRDTDAVQRAYLRFCARLARRGMVRAAHEGARDFAMRACARFPQQADAIADITARYLALRYEGRNDPASLQGFRHAVAAFKL